MEKIAEIVKLFQPKEKKGGSGAKTSNEELIREAKRRRIKLPRKGL